MKNVKKPCQDCIYFKTCGETTRTMPCYGRETKSQKKKENKKMKKSRFFIQAHIHSLNGEMKTVELLDKRMTDGSTEYIVKYNDVTCTAIFNPFTGTFYADDKYGIIKEAK